MTSVEGIDGYIWMRQLVEGREEGKNNNVYHQASRRERLSDKRPEGFKDTRGLSRDWLGTAAERQSANQAGSTTLAAEEVKCVRSKNKESIGDKVSIKICFPIFTAVVQNPSSVSVHNQQVIAHVQI